MAIIKIHALMTIRKQRWLTRQVAVENGEVVRTAGTADESPAENAAAADPLTQPLGRPQPVGYGSSPVALTEPVAVGAVVGAPAPVRTEQPRPHPQPGPRPSPQPHPHPGPQPHPHPGPHPGPRPSPRPQAGAHPAPPAPQNAQPAPHPQPNPRPQPNRRAQPGVPA